MPKQNPLKIVVRQSFSGNPKVQRLRDNVDLRVELSEWQAGESLELPDTPVLGLCRELVLLQAMVQKPWNDSPALLAFQPLEERDSDAACKLAALYLDFVNYIWGCTATYIPRLPSRGSQPSKVSLRPSSNALYLTGLNIGQLLTPGSTPLLFRRTEGTLGIIFMHLHNAGSLVEAEAIARTLLPESGKSPSVEESSQRNDVQMMADAKSIIDFRTGLEIPAQPTPEEFRAFLLSALPLPAEVVL